MTLEGGSGATTAKPAGLGGHLGGHLEHPRPVLEGCTVCPCGVVTGTELHPRRQALAQRSRLRA